MRLINCDTLRMESEGHWVNRLVPQYAILSHTWAGDGEVTYQEYLVGRSRHPDKDWNKIDRTIEIARQHGFHHVWIDSCCIDKQNNAEMEESINSMFQWYADAAVCYAHIADFRAGCRYSDASFSPDQSTREVRRRLGSCRWFRRGWTLQELIAPSVVNFFDQNWSFFGTRDELSLTLSHITNIDHQILKNRDLHQGSAYVSQLLSRIPVAQKMSWASSRITTKIEDQAYSMIGLFGVDMHTRYGEGKRAFTRLQEEIIKKNRDMTIFAWEQPKQYHTSRSGHYGGILATSPRDFQHSDSLMLSIDPGLNPTYSISQKGLLICTKLVQVPGSDVLFMNLNCHEKTADSASHWPTCGILLQFIGAGMYSRVNPHKLYIEPENGTRLPKQDICIAEGPPTVRGPMASSLFAEHYLSASDIARDSIRLKVDDNDQLERTWISAEEHWEKNTRTFVTTGVPNFCEVVMFSTQKRMRSHYLIVACEMLADGGGRLPRLYLAEANSEIVAAWKENMLTTEQALAWVKDNAQDEVSIFSRRPERCWGPRDFIKKIRDRSFFHIQGVRVSLRMQETVRSGVRAFDLTVCASKCSGSLSKTNICKTGAAALGTIALAVIVK